MLLDCHILIEIVSHLAYEIYALVVLRCSHDLTFIFGVVKTKIPYLLIENFINLSICYNL